jgi:hypothetical protein
MGYTHYWKKPAGLNKNDFEKAIPIIRDIIERHKDVLCYEYDMPDAEPVCDKEMIRFNGVGDEGHETFMFTPDAEEFSFCKTARKDYDIAVCECLIILQHFTSVEVSSDGMSGYLSDEPVGLMEGDIVESPDGAWGEAMCNVHAEYDLDYVAICTEIRGDYYEWELKSAKSLEEEYIEDDDTEEINVKIVQKVTEYVSGRIRVPKNLDAIALQEYIDDHTDEVQFDGLDDSQFDEIVSILPE